MPPKNFSSADQQAIKDLLKSILVNSDELQQANVKEKILLNADTTSKSKNFDSAIERSN